MIIVWILLMFEKIQCIIQFKEYEIFTDEITKETLNKEYTKIVVSLVDFNDMVETFSRKEEDYVKKIRIFYFFIQKIKLNAPLTKKYKDVTNSYFNRCLIVSKKFRRFLNTEILSDNELKRVFFDGWITYKPLIGDKYFDCVRTK